MFRRPSASPGGVRAGRALALGRGIRRGGRRELFRATGETGSIHVLERDGSRRLQPIPDRLRRGGRGCSRRPGSITAGPRLRPGRRSGPGSAGEILEAVLPSRAGGAHRAGGGQRAGGSASPLVKAPPCPAFEATTAEASRGIIGRSHRCNQVASGGSAAAADSLAWPSGFRRSPFISSLCPVGHDEPLEVVGDQLLRQSGAVSPQHRGVDAGTPGGSSTRTSTYSFCLVRRLPASMS